MDVFCIVQQTVKLSTPTKKTQLQTPLAYNNTLAHAMRVTVLNEDGTDALLTGVGVTASMMRADGETVTPILGTATGNVAEVILPGACYVVPGRFKFCMNLFKATPTTGINDFSTSTSYAKGALVVYNDVVYRFIATHAAGAWKGTGENGDVVPDGSMRTVLWVEGYVERNTTEEIVDPGTPVGNITQAITNAQSAASEAQEAAAAAQTVIEESMLQSNVAPQYSTEQMYSKDDVVWYNGTLYRAKNDITTTGAFDSSKWYTATVLSLMNNRRDQAEDYTDDLQHTIALNFSQQTSYDVGDFVYYGGNLYRFKASHTGAWSSSDVDAVRVCDIGLTFADDGTGNITIS